MELTPMTVLERRKYLAQMRPRYRAATKATRRALLDEMVAVTGLHRKSLLRLMASDDLARRPRTIQRGRTYGAAVDAVIRLIWETLDYVCAERLTPALVETADLLVQHGELVLPDPVRVQLATISRASVQRRLTQFAKTSARLPRKGPERANQLARTIPMQRIPWDTSDPGHFEVDLVHHGGSEPYGEYAYTLQMIDVATGWSERVAVLGKSQGAMEGGFRTILARLPFPVRELHSDNGSEFINNHLVRIWGTEMTGMMLTRSRPYQKNDNRFVEQKNASLVRAYLGQLRFDTPAQTAALNTLYEQMWLYYNMFQPVLHLVEKGVVGERMRRRWDTAQTPWARVKVTNVLTAEAQERLETVRQATNPRALRRAIYSALEQLWAGLPAGVLGVVHAAA